MDHGDPGLLFFGIVALVSSAGIAYFSILRQRWALIVSTILSFNPLWMFINIAYLKNRWPEFRAKGLTKAGTPLSAKLKDLPRAIRGAVLSAITWMVCSLSFVFLFQPYGGYMRDDDIAHMFGVILLPVAIGLGLFFLYRKFFE